MSSLQSRERYSMNRTSFGEKILVQKSVKVDLEAGAQDVALPDRASTYTLTSEGGSAHEQDRAPVSPATAAAKSWMRPPSVSHGPYETKSEMVTLVPGIDGGRRVMVVTPTPALSALGRHARPESPLSRTGSLKGDIFSRR